MRQINPSITLAFNSRVRDHVKLKKEIISLGLGEAEIKTPPHIVEAGIKALRDGMTKYSAPQGLPALRERIAHRLKSSHDIAARAEQIIVTPGAKNALFLACAALLEPGDEVVLLRPCYVSNLPILQIASSGVQVRDVYLSPPHFDLNHDRLSSAITPKTKLIFLNSPNNPTGRMFSANDIEFLGALLRQHPHSYALSDEVYASMSLGDPKHIPLASIADISERVITVGGFSKTYFMTGWRIGYLHASDALTRAMLTIHEHINTNTAAFIQIAAIAALDGSQECVLSYVQKLRERKDIYDRTISRSSYLYGTKFEGGYFAFVDISESQMDCDRFAVELLDKENVALVPGLAFGRNHSAYCRLSFVNKTEIFREGLTRIQRFIEAVVDG
jgi:aspartate aminotransferase